jgi:hypothetical protein
MLVDATGDDSTRAESVVPRTPPLSQRRMNSMPWTGARSVLLDRLQLRTSLPVWYQARASCLLTWFWRVWSAAWE